MPAGNAVPPDWVRDKVAEAAKAQGLSAYALAKLTGGQVSQHHLRQYLAGRRSLTSDKLQHVLRVLGLTIEEAYPPI